MAEEPAKKKEPTTHRVLAPFTADKYYDTGSKFTSSDEKQIKKLTNLKLIK